MLLSSSSSLTKKKSFKVLFKAREIRGNTLSLLAAPRSGLSVMKSELVLMLLFRCWESETDFAKMSVLLLFFFKKFGLHSSMSI